MEGALAVELLAAAICAEISTARLLLPDVAIPAALRQLTHGWRGILLASSVLLCLRLLWIAVYVSGVSGDQPP